jgi:16S rRNA (uracil1498-N3)-methyltransferase
VVLRGQEGRHASTVRRLSPGERVDLTDGAGTVAQCVVTAARPGELELDVLARQVEPRPQPQVTVLQAIPKGDRGELAAELLTEAGADVIVPWAAQRRRIWARRRE